MEAMTKFENRKFTETLERKKDLIIWIIGCRLYSREVMLFGHYIIDSAACCLGAGLSARL